MEKQKQRRTMSVLYRYVVMLLYVLGVQLYFFNYSYVSLLWQFLLCAIVGGVSFLFYLLEKKRGTAKNAGIAAFVAAGVFALLANVGLLRGFIKLINVWILRWNQYHEDGKNLIAMGQENTSDEGAVLLVIGFVIFGILLLVKDKTKFIFMNILTIVLLILSLMNGRVVWIATACLLLGVIGMWFCRSLGHVYVKVLWLGIIAAVILCVPYVMPTKDLTFTKNMRENTSQKVKDLRYGKNPLPEGDLYQAYQMAEGNKETLRVKTEQVKTLYLRGFEGGLYKDGVWQDLSKASYGYRHSGMFSWLASNHFEPSFEYASYMNFTSDKIASNKVAIQVTGADRECLYAPYSVKSIEKSGYRLDKDKGIYSTSFLGSKQYEVEEKSNELPGELIVAENWIKDPKTNQQKQYMEAEQVYRKFVYESYCYVDSSLDSYITKYFYDKAKTKDMTGIYAITCFIRNELKGYANYRKNPKQVPSDADPILWFLTEGHEGNSTLFASAAVLAFRKFGIPARYAEGYLLQKEKISKAKGHEVALTNQDGHAWVEVYMDGIGWIDIDVTPGFYYEEYDLMQMVEKPQGIQMTAELEEQNKESSGDADGIGKGKKKPEKEHSDYMQYASGLFVLIFAVIVFTIFFLEIKRYFCYRHWRSQVRKAGQKEKCNKIYQMVFRQIELLGIEAGMGWQTVEVEQKIRDKVPSVFEGEYVQMNALMEKGIYGGKELADWEVHALFHFANKLIFDAKMKKVGFGYVKKRYA